MKLTSFCMMLLSMPACAQQNLFNVPSAELTKTKHLFVQEQINCNSVLESNTTLSAGLTKNLEAGINLFNATLYSFKADDPASFSGTDLLVNVQYALCNTERYFVSAGTQSGVNVGNGSFSTSDYIINSFRFHDRFKVIGGAYTTNPLMQADHPAGGFLGGFDLAVVRNKLNMTADIIAGNNTMSVWVAGFTWFIRSNRALSFGYQHPSFTTNNPSGVVLELTFL